MPHPCPPRRRALRRSALVLLLAAPAAAQETGAQETGQPFVLEPVTAVSTKRGQDPARVDTMLLTQDAETLTARGIRSLDQLDRMFPDLTIRPRSGRIYSNATMRGQTSADFYSPSVQVLVDGLPQDFAMMGQLLPVQIEQVEALYGPQGTLYGAGAVGGVLNITTRRPDNQLRFGRTASFSNRAADAGLMANLPLVPDVLYGDVSFNWREQDGNYRSPTGSSDFGGTRDFGGQVRLRYAPTGSPWDVMVQAARTVLNSTEEQFVLGSALSGRQALPFDSHYRLRLDAYGLIGSYTADSFVVSALSSYQDRDLDRVIQGYISPETQTQFSQELRIASRPDAGGRFAYTAGLFYQHTDFERRTPQFGQTAQQTQNAYAAFGELTWHITDRLDLTPGLRVDLIRTEAQATGPIRFDVDRDDTALTPKIALGYQLTPETRVYALYSSGFKPGGFTRTVSAYNASFQYGSADTDNFEAGVKSRLWGGRVEVAAAGYYAYTRDYQNFAGSQPFQYLQNVGDVESYGFDAKVTAYPVDRLAITATLGLNHARFRNYRDPTGAGQDLSGNRPAYAPPVTAGLDVGYSFRLPREAGEVTPRIGLTYVGRIYFDDANTVSQGGYTLVDASVGWAITPTLRADIFGTNLTNKRYATYGFDAGPFIGGVYQLGTGREGGLRLTAEF